MGECKFTSPYRVKKTPAGFGVFVGGRSVAAPNQKGVGSFPTKDIADQVKRKLDAEHKRFVCRRRLI